MGGLSWWATGVVGDWGGGWTEFVGGLSWWATGVVGGLSWWAD